MVAVLGGMYGVAAREDAIEFDKRRRVAWRVEGGDSEKGFDLKRVLLCKGLFSFSFFFNFFHFF
jgi:hypothetical protein